MKTKEELDVLKKEIETLNKKLAELTEDELKQVTGGWHWGGNWGDDGYFQFDLKDPFGNKLKRSR